MSKTALVTGIARGIGRAVAERFLQEGYVVHGTFHSSEEKARDLQKKYGADRLVIYGSYNFCDLAQTQALIRELSSIRFDTIVPSAGMFSENDDFNNFNLEEFNQTMHCNFYTPLMLTVGLHNNVNEGGSIIIMSSNDALPGAFASMSYSISKSALISLMKCLAVNYGKKKVRVNAVAPGAIDTDMNTEEQMEISPYFTPISCVGSPVDVAKAVYFLASDEASFINGETILIDGGYNIVSVLLKSEADPPLSENLRNFIKKHS
jgi:NAD(P)-dependent dehydrogenase (short-subunit alcohol dehydrogenase family)